MLDSKKSDSSLLKRLHRLLLRAPESNKELIDIICEAKERALIDNDSFRMIQGVLTLADTTVGDIMVPRPQMDMLEADMTIKEVLAIVTESAHSRFPIFDTSDNKVVGILLAKDLLQLLHDNPAHKNIQDLLRPAVFIPESKRLNVLLREFRLKHNHMAIVIDEYGNIDGLITIEDVLEQIVGSIVDEHDTDEAIVDYIKQLDVNVAEVNALTPIHDFNTHFEKNFDEEACDTIGGLVLQKFSHLPKKGETIEIDDLEITVLKATNRGIQKLRVYRNV